MSSRDEPGARVLLVEGNRNSDGHGIGLSIVARLSQRFGWPVTMDSSPEAGTRVTVTFPAVGAGSRTA